MRILTKIPNQIERYGENSVCKAKNHCNICDSYGYFSGSGADYLLRGKRQGI